MDNNGNEPNAPLDIKRGWLSVARRLQSIARTEGYAVVSINILVGPDGNPLAWTEPKLTKIEPKRSSDILALFSSRSLP